MVNVEHERTVQRFTFRSRDFRTTVNLSHVITQSEELDILTLPNAKVLQLGSPTNQGSLGTKKFRHWANKINQCKFQLFEQN